MTHGSVSRANLVDRLLAEGHQVIGVDNFSTGMPSNLERALNRGTRSPRFTMVSVDIQAPELVDIVAGANPHVLFHLAAQVDVGTSVSDPQYDARTNVLGTINVCEASRQSGVRHILYATASDAVDPLSPHAAAKLAGEFYMRAYAAMYGLAPICLSLANVYGPRQIPRPPAGVIAAVANSMITNCPHTVYRDRSADHDYVYVDDVVDAFVLAGCAPHGATGTYRIGSGVCTTIAEVHDLIAAALDGTRSGITTGHVRLPPEDVNVRKAMKDLGWQPKVGISEGIQRTVEWLCAGLESDQPELVGA